MSRPFGTREKTKCASRVYGLKEEAEALRDEVVKDFYERVTGFKVTMMQPQGAHFILSRPRKCNRCHCQIRLTSQHSGEIFYPSILVRPLSTERFTSNRRSIRT